VQSIPVVEKHASSCCVANALASQLQQHSLPTNLPMLGEPDAVGWEVGTAAAVADAVARLAIPSLARALDAG